MITDRLREENGISSDEGSESPPVCFLCGGNCGAGGETCPFCNGTGQ